MCLHLRFWINLQDALLHHLDLDLANGLAGCMELSVQIGQTDQIIIHKHKTPNTGTNQSFYHEGAHAADTKYGNLASL